MAIYDLAGQGVQALTGGVTRLFVETLSLPPGYSTGEAIPTNYFHIGLLRVGVEGAYAAPRPIDAIDLFIDLPTGANLLGYSVREGGLIRVSENVTVPPPGENLSLLDPAYVPAHTFTNTVDGVLVISWVPAVNLFLQGLRYWRAPGDTMHSAISYVVFNYSAGPAEIKSGAQSGLVEGWNEWTFAPIAMNAGDAYGFHYLSLATGIRSDDTAPVAATPGDAITAFGYRWKDGDDLSDPGGLNASGNFNGNDILYTVA